MVGLGVRGMELSMKSTKKFCVFGIDDARLIFFALAHKIFLLLVFYDNYSPKYYNIIIRRFSIHTMEGETKQKCLDVLDEFFKLENSGRRDLYKIIF